MGISVVTFLDLMFFSKITVSSAGPPSHLRKFALWVDQGFKLPDCSTIYTFVCIFQDFARLELCSADTKAQQDKFKG